jgi:molybdenum cofactor cytidylyltransferase
MPESARSMDPGAAANAAGSTAAVVLAAGSSTRMGENKLLLALDGETVVSRAVRAAAAAGLDPIVVVLGHEPDGVRAALAGLSCRTVWNPDHARGQGTSLQAGIAEVAAKTTASAAVVMLADMPFVTAPMLARVAERARQPGAPAENGAPPPTVRCSPSCWRCRARRAARRWCAATVTRQRS